MSCPWNSTLPEVGFISPFRCCTKVDLPDPVCPISPMYSPVAASKSTSHRAACSKGVPMLYTCPNFSVLIIGSNCFTIPFVGASLKQMTPCMPRHAAFHARSAPATASAHSSGESASRGIENPFLGFICI